MFGTRLNRAEGKAGGLRRPSAIGAVVALALGGAAIASPATADDGAGLQARVLDLGGWPLNIRQEPNTTSTVVGTVNTGDTVLIGCQIEGPEVHNDIDGYTSTQWDYLPAAGGYVSDAWVYTGYNGPAPGVPTCGDDTPPPDPEDPGDGTGPCPDAAPFPAEDSSAAVIAAMERTWSVDFADGAYSWTADRYRPVVQVWWDSFEKVGCTDYLDRVAERNSGKLTIKAMDLGGWWGEYYGYNWGAPLQGIDIENQFVGLQGSGADQVEWNIIHELAHSVNNDRSDNGEAFAFPGYWSEFGALHHQYGPLTDYGTKPTESFADLVGYFVDRCGGEWSAPNPYDADSAAAHAYFDYVKENFFNGRSFGPEPGSSC